MMFQENGERVFIYVWNTGMERGEFNSLTMFYRFFFLNWTYVKEPDEISS